MTMKKNKEELSFDISWVSSGVFGIQSNRKKKKKMKINLRVEDLDQMKEEVLKEDFHSKQKMFFEFC